MSEDLPVEFGDRFVKYRRTGAAFVFAGVLCHASVPRGTGILPVLIPTGKMPMPFGEGGSLFVLNGGLGWMHISIVKVISARG